MDSAFTFYPTSMHISSLFLLAFLGIASGPAMAADEWTGEEDEDTEDEGDEGDPSPLPPGDIDDAEPIPGLSKRQHAWLEPKRNRLPQNPRAQTDFTAYTLEWGETKVGLASITVGALPRTQLGTVPALDILGMANAHLKVNAVRVDPWDLAIGGNLYRLKAGDFVGSHTGITLMNSVQLMDPWSMHLGMGYNVLVGDGVPDLSQLPGVLRSASANSDDFAQSQEGKEENWYFRARSLTMSLATDVRFNRRDSLILQASAMLWADLDRGFEAPPILGLDEALDAADDGGSPVGKSYIVSVAWQFAWKRTDLRLGAGISNVPGAWVLPSTDLSYRFGGKTRRSERRMNKTWRRNKADTKVQRP